MKKFIVLSITFLTMTLCFICSSNNPISATTIYKELKGRIFIKLHCFSPGYSMALISFWCKSANSCAAMLHHS